MLRGTVIILIMSCLAVCPMQFVFFPDSLLVAHQATEMCLQRVRYCRGHAVTLRLLLCLRADPAPLALPSLPADLSFHNSFLSTHSGFASICSNVAHPFLPVAFMPTQFGPRILRYTPTLTQFVPRVLY